MLSLEDLQVISRRAEEQRDWLLTEESIKTALVLPFIGALGYDYHNPSEVFTELTADVGTRKHEKVDYAILRDGKPIILFECKALGNPLSAAEMSQLTRYFNNTDAAIGVLTNGVVYKFFTDLDKINIMDQSPFLEVDISKADRSVVVELQRFAKGSFDPEEIKATAKAATIEAKVIRDVKAKLEVMYNDPDDDFSKALAGDVRDMFGVGRTSQSLMERIRPLVKRAFHEFVREHSSAGISGEFPQVISAGEFQSAPEQAAVIHPSALPAAPTDSWQSLSDIQPKRGDVKPTHMRLPDNSVVAITTWSQVTFQAVRWLTDNYHLLAAHCPIQQPRLRANSRSQYIVATQPIHPSGREFKRAREVNSLYIELNYNVPDTARNTKIIIQRTGMDVSQFLLKWDFRESAREHGSAGISGELPQDTIAGASQSIPVQAVAIPHNPLSGAPTGGWRALSDIQPEQGDDKPTQMMFPDGSAVAISAWNRLVMESVRWLTDNGYLDARHCPIRYLSRYLVATQPIHPTGRDFTYPQKVNGLYMELGFNAPRSARNANTIIKHVGLDPSQFKLRW